MERSITPEQVAAIRSVMQVFVHDDRASGVPADKQMFCDACQTGRPARGFIQYDRHMVCNECAIDYEIARARGLVLSAAEFVRGRAFEGPSAYTPAGDTP
jgi:hypothetical protein